MRHLSSAGSLLVFGGIVAVGIGTGLLGEAPTPPAPSIYLNTLGASLNPSGAVLIHRERIGPLLPDVAAGYDIKVIFTKPVPGETKICRVIGDGMVCTTLEQALAVPR